MKTFRFEYTNVNNKLVSTGTLFYDDFHKELYLSEVVLSLNRNILGPDGTIMVANNLNMMLNVQKLSANYTPSYIGGRIENRNTLEIWKLDKSTHFTLRLCVKDYVNIFNILKPI